MNKPGLYFMHYRRRDSYGGALPQGGATLAIRPMSDKIVVAAAFCSKHEVFNKRLGRTIAEGRLGAYKENSQNRHVFVIDINEPDAPIKEIVDITMAPLMYNLGLD